MPKKTAAELRLSRPPPAKRLDEADIANDPAPDVYTVRWDTTRTVVIVAHYPNRLATRACCQVSGRVTDDDRARSSAEIPAEVYTLSRLRMPCGVDEKK